MRSTWVLSAPALAPIEVSRLETARRSSAVAVASGTPSMLDAPLDYYYARRGNRRPLAGLVPASASTSPSQPIRRGGDAQRRSLCPGRDRASRSSPPTKEG